MFWTTLFSTPLQKVTNSYRFLCVILRLVNVVATKPAPARLPSVGRMSCQKPAPVGAFQTTASLKVDPPAPHMGSFTGCRADTCFSAVLCGLEEWPELPWSFPQIAGESLFPHQGPPPPTLCVRRAVSLTFLSLFSHNCYTVFFTLS